MIRPEDLDDLLDREEGAKLIRTSVATLDRLIKSGQIEVVRIGGHGRGRIFMTRRQLLDYLNRARTRAKPAS